MEGQNQQTDTDGHQPAVPPPSAGSEHPACYVIRLKLHMLRMEIDGIEKELEDLEKMEGRKYRQYGAEHSDVLALIEPFMEDAESYLDAAKRLLPNVETKEEDNGSQGY